MASASSEAGSTRSQEIEELERFIDSYVLEYQVQGLLGDKADGDLDADSDVKVPEVSALSQQWMTRNFFFLRGSSMWTNASVPPIKRRGRRRQSVRGN